MDRRLIGRAILLRHGQTEYTGAFPDLTEEGKQTIEESARKILNLVAGAEKVILVSSPRPRALGSAFIIKNALGGKRYEIVVSRAISAMGIVNEDLAQAIFKEYRDLGGVAAIDISYTRDPRYEDSKVFEPRSLIRQRFYCYLASLVKEMLANENPVAVVCVSHYECLYHLVEELFQLDYARDRTLAHGEIIAVCFYHTEGYEVVQLEVCFRGHTRTVAFNRNTGMLSPII